ncbi:restriction endonuclease [Endozoicomonadaceae bacterium StTr2]
MNKKYILVRSPRTLIAQGEVGYGWKRVDFSAYEAFTDLVTKGFKEGDYQIGRRRKQVKRYYDLKQGDIVIVPVSRAIAIAEVEGTKTYHPETLDGDSANRSKVSFLKDSNGNSFIARKLLSSRLQSRLKIRMAVADLGEFSDEIDKHIAALHEGKIHTWSNEIQKHEENQEREFREKLLARLRSGKDLALEAGGYGLEKLIAEILEANGYATQICAKNQSSGIEDIDIEASRQNGLTNDTEKLYIQAKHHRGITGITGLKQLKEFGTANDEATFVRKVLVTTADLTESLKADAVKHDVVTIEGEGLVKWIYSNLDKLSPQTQAKLGILNIPRLI